MDWGANISVWRSSDGTPLSGLDNADLILDAVLGTGRSRPLAGPIKETLDRVRDAKARRPGLQTVALDMPTGLDADTGALDPSVFPADVTVTLGFPKQGLYRGGGPSASGRIITVDIGIPNGYADGIDLELMTPAMVRPLLPRRPMDANKGTFGKVLIIAGSGNFIGAAVLACRGALRAGAGLVTLAAPARLVEMVAGSLVEPTYLPLPATATGAIAASAANDVLPRLGEFNAVAIGCGLGQDPETAAFLDKLLELSQPIVIDADALNLLAGMGDWWTGLKTQAVLTPHPGEMARLLNTTIQQVQEDRIETARKASKAWGQTAVLKGAHTVVARPDGLTRVSPFAVPALATGGTGDVLTGIIAGLMAQGVEPFEAATSGVYLHGRAGQRFTELHSESGLIASDLPGLLPDLFQELQVRS
jgi:ADP-dependent NAD(P)H-hydrate dehydratase / NAD(P)H-hydrate epimerase